MITIKTKALLTSFTPAKVTGIEKENSDLLIEPPAMSIQLCGPPTFTDYFVGSENHKIVGAINQIFSEIMFQGQKISITIKIADDD